ncbi:hypothetical protein, partial [Alloscardovia macacae]
DLNGLEFTVYGGQMTGESVNIPQLTMTYNGGQATNTMGRQIYGQTAAQVQDAAQQAPLWKGKRQPVLTANKNISSSDAVLYSSTGAMDLFMSVVEPRGYEQGTDKVYIPDFSKRIQLSDSAKAAGWSIEDFTVTGLPAGVAYDSQTDTIQGSIIGGLDNSGNNSIEYGFQGAEVNFTAKNSQTGVEQKFAFGKSSQAIIAFQYKDTKAPTLDGISGKTTTVDLNGTVNLYTGYNDNGGTHAGRRNGANVPLQLVDAQGNPLGRTATVRNKLDAAVIGMAGQVTTTGGNAAVGSIADTTIPGLSFTGNVSVPAADRSGKAVASGFDTALTGTASQEGIYVVPVFAKDSNAPSHDYNINGNEAHGYTTVVVKPQIVVKNVHAYATEIPVSISSHATTATIQTPDGSVTNLKAVNGSWLVDAGTTNSAVKEGDTVGTVGQEFNLKVTSDATAKADVDNIKAQAFVEDASVMLYRNKVELTDIHGTKVTASFNAQSGQWELPSDYREVVNGDTTTYRHILTNALANGDTEFGIYEYHRTRNAAGEATAVSTEDIAKTTVPREQTSSQQGMTVLLKYSKATDTWTASDGSSVTDSKADGQWHITPASEFDPITLPTIASSDDKATVVNDAPTSSSTSYEAIQGQSVNTIHQPAAGVNIVDTEDDSTTPHKNTKITSVLVVYPDGTTKQETFNIKGANWVEQGSASSDLRLFKLDQTGEYKVTVNAIDSNGNLVTADSDTATGVNAGDNTATTSTTYTITVKASSTTPIVVFEGDKIDSTTVNDNVTPANVAGYTSAKKDPSDVPSTDGQAGKTLSAKTSVTYTPTSGDAYTEEVSVPVIVLPRAKSTVTVSVGTSDDVLKGIVKTEADRVLASDDFKKSLPEGATVTSSDITEAIAAGLTAQAGENRGTVNVPVTYTLNGQTYTATVPVTVNVVAKSTTTPTYVFDGDKVQNDDVKKHVTPQKVDGFTAKVEDTTDLPNTSGQAGKTLSSSTTITYTNDATGQEFKESVDVPVIVLPKTSGEVTVSKGTSDDTVKSVVKSEAERAVKQKSFTDLLPAGAKVVATDVTEAIAKDLTAEAGQNRGIVNVPVTYTVGDETFTTTVPVTVNVVDNASSTPLVVFEGDEVKKSDITSKVTPQDVDGYTSTTTVDGDTPDTKGQGGQTLNTTTTVTYTDETTGRTFSEKVTVPVVVLPKASSQVTVSQGTSDDELKAVVKSEADRILTSSEFTSRLPQGATVVSSDITEAIKTGITAEPGQNRGIVNVPVAYTLNGQTYTATVPVTVNVVAKPVPTQGKTFFRDPQGKELIPSVNGKTDPISIKGYKFVRTIVENGNTIHIYEPVTPTNALAKTGTAIVTILVVALVAVAAGVAFVVIRKRNAGDHKE